MTKKQKIEEIRRIMHHMAIRHNKPLLACCPAERYAMLRLRKLKNMTIEDLYKLNDKLAGKGHNWLTSERAEVCTVLVEKLHAWFNQAT